MVSGASYANCDGQYEYTKDQVVSWAPDKPVYKHVTKNRYVFYSNWKDGNWVIGTSRELTTGSYFHQSK